MKKSVTLLCFVLVFSMLLSPLCLAAEENTDTLADWNITIVVPEGATAVLKGSSYYIYAKKTGAIPYVMLTTYRYDSEEQFLKDFTAYMQKQYSDLKVTSEAEQKTIGGKVCYEIDYTYKVSGYDVRDRRIVMIVNGLTYLFASKEIESRGDTLGSMLEDVIADCIFLDESGNELSELEEAPPLANTYLFREENGMPKYWLDFTGGVADNLVLHCYFRSGEPTFYEQCFILDLNTADITDELITIHKVYDLEGNDCSGWFKQLSIRLDGETVTMTVRRDETTLAGGGDDNLLTGLYLMEPQGAGIIYEYRLENGQLKYSLDVAGEDLQLRAMFRSGDPEYYEEIFILDLDSAAQSDDGVLMIKKVFRESGEDVSRWFKSLGLSDAQGAVMMKVERDERTLAGGADDNILTGEYRLEPRTYLLPEEEGPYSAPELCEWAQIYYFTRFGYFPPEAEAEKNADGSFTIHLYEIVTLDGDEHTATSAWYTVDAYGVGVNTITEEGINLFA